MTSLLKKSTLYALALFLAALYFVPILFVVGMALRPLMEVFSEPGRILPDSFRWQNFPDALKAAAFGTYFLNSTIVAVAGTFLQVTLSCMAGYALARIPFRGRDPIFYFIVILLVIPPQITMLPLFIMAKNTPFFGGNDHFGQGGIGLLDSYPGLLLPHLVSPLGIFLLRQFFLAIPEDLADAVRIDGGSEWTILWKIFVPLSIPAVTTVALFSFQSTWNDFLWPLIVTRRDEMKTLQLGLTVFYQENSAQLPFLMAAVLMASVPIVVIFLFAQRRFVQGVAAGALKG